MKYLIYKIAFINPLKMHCPKKKKNALSLECVEK